MAIFIRKPRPTIPSIEGDPASFEKKGRGRDQNFPPIGGIVGPANRENLAFLNSRTYNLSDFDLLELMQSCIAFLRVNGFHPSENK